MLSQHFLGIQSLKYCHFQIFQEHYFAFDPVFHLGQIEIFYPSACKNPQLPPLAGRVQWFLQHQDPVIRPIQQDPSLPPVLQKKYKKTDKYIQYIINNR